jgi:esterase
VHNSAFLNNFHYQISGNPKGNKLVFLHGVMGSAANWRRIIKDFEADFEILAYDQRGHGRSFQPASGYELRDFAEDLAHILTELNWEQIYLVGHSMGGRNALKFTELYKQRVKKLVIEDIGPERSSGSVSRIERLLDLVPTPFSSRTQAREFFQNTYPGLIGFYSQPEALSRFFYSNITEKENGQSDWRFAKEAILQSMRLGRQEDLWNTFRSLDMPTLLIRGANSDDLPRPTFERMLKENPHVQGIEIADSGHWVHFDQPEAFIAALKTFFEH